MRSVLVAAFLLLVLGLSAFAADPLPTERLPDKPAASGVYHGGGRVGGDAISDAAVIPALPFTDTGSTCGFANDYDEVCPYTGSTAPDVVYSYSVTAEEHVTVSLCASEYDTKVYIYQDGAGNLVACNDDAGCGYSGWQSKLVDVLLPGGHTYYFVIDGYGDSCGAYDLSIHPYTPCVVECPEHGLIEGEPPCGDGYLDSYNSGCNGWGWTPIEPYGDECCRDVCGKSGTWMIGTGSYRDTDWYDVVAGPNPFTVSGKAEFPVYVWLVYVPECHDLQYIVAAADACEDANLTWDFPAGEHAWIIVAPQMFEGVPCESDYTLHVCGFEVPPGGSGACCFLDGHCEYLMAADCPDGWQGPCTDCSPNPCPQPPVPVERTSWGRIKSGYRR